MKNLGLKLFSLVAALMLFWFVNSESNSSSQMLSVPIHFRNIPAGKIIISPIQPRAQVTIKGPNSLVSKMAEAQRAFDIVIPARVENGYVATLRREDLGLEPYFSVLKIEPSEVALTFDTLVSKDVTVHVPRIGSLKEGLTLDEFVVNPDRVHLSGPDTELRALNEIETYPIDLRDIDSSTSRTLGIKLPGALSEISPKQVNVRVQVSAILGQQEYRDLPIELRARAAGGFRVDPALVSLTVSGANDKLATLKREEIVPYVRLKDDALDQEELAVSVDLPAGCKVLALNPAKVKLSKIKMLNDQSAKRAGSAAKSKQVR